MSVNPQRPLIGVTGSAQNGRTLRAMTHYAVRRAGGRPIALTPGRDLDLDRLDGVVISGGVDIDPTLYGQANLAARRIDPARDELEREVLGWALRHKKPVLAICRGMQLLTVTFGGSLHQDASAVFPAFRPTRGILRQVTRRRPVRIIKQGLIASVLGEHRDVHMVNSLHHQTIADVGTDLEVVAVDEHGMAQAVEPIRKDGYMIGVQWHPELMPHSRSQRAFFRRLVDKSRRH